MLVLTSMSEKVPRLVASIDVRKFKLDPMDGFLLTRINGKLGPKQLAQDTGLPDFSVDRALEKLQKLGIIELVDPNAAPAKTAEQRAEMPQFGGGLSEPKYDTKELEEECDLTLEQRKRVLDMFYRIDDLDHWTLLGITRDADKKAMKRAYFEVAAVMHPDRYFKKKLGSFKSKMEILFARITEAHDTLLDPQKRADYEVYLAEVATTRGMEAMLERAMAEQAAAGAAAAAAAAAASPADAGASAPPAPQPTIPQGPSAQELQARREALARRLLGGNAAPRASQAAAPPVERPNPQKYTNSQDAVDALKRRYEDRVEHATVSQAKRYVQSAEEALAKGDLVAASSAFNIATKFAPNDAELAVRAQETRNEAEKILCESYLKQAQYEEKQARWPEAARSWQKVARIKLTDAHVHDRAAHAVLMADGDLHQAAEHAKTAISCDPSVVGYHVKLAEIYWRAGLAASARRAAETGLALDPDNVTLQNIVKKTK
jgi:hypothetical protein